MHRLQEHLLKDSELMRGYESEIVFSRQGKGQYHALLKLTSGEHDKTGSNDRHSYTFDLVNLQLRKLLKEPLVGR